MTALSFKTSPLGSGSKTLRSLTLVRVRNPDYAAVAIVARDFIISPRLVIAMNRRLVITGDVMPLLRERGAREHRDDAKRT